MGLNLARASPTTRSHSGNRSSTSYEANVERVAERREVDRNETSDGPSGEGSEPRGREATAGSSGSAARAQRPVSERVRAFTDLR